jgi:Domain of unknown function (DUF4476)
MKKIVSLIFFCTLCCYGLIAQQKNYFIYFQTEKNIPFYIKYANKIYSSTVRGYQILAKLPVGEHKIFLGFPKSADKEIPFICKIENSDLGFKIFQTNQEWQLLNINALSVIKPYSTDVVAAPPPLVESPPKIITQEEKEKTKEPIIKEVEIVKETPDKPIIPATNIPKLSFKSKTELGVEAIYITETDSIIIFVPMLAAAKEDKPSVEVIPEKEAKPNIEITPLKKDSLVVKPKQPSIEPIKQVEPVTEKETKFLDFAIKADTTKKTDSKPIDATNIDSVPKNNTSKAQLVLKNTDCQKIATNDDFVDLRKKMAGKKQDDEMLFEAAKAFKKRCFLTDQIKGLGVLLSSDEWRYKLYDMAYIRVYDTETFKLLVNTLTDKYYINRFNALVNR